MTNEPEIIYQTERLLLANEYEYTYLLDKRTNKILFEDDFYANPTCGIIDKDNQWAIVAGEHLTLWKKHKKAHKAENSNELNGITHKYHTNTFQWIADIRLVDDKSIKNTVEILIDPWSEHPAIWQLCINNGQLLKIRDFTDYQGKLFTEEVEW